MKLLIAQIKFYKYTQIFKLKEKSNRIKISVLNFFIISQKIELKKRKAKKYLKNHVVI